MTDTITTNEVLPGHWVATFDGYDGAPDAVGKYAQIGTGRTADEAIANLMERCEGLK